MLGFKIRTIFNYKIANIFGLFENILKGFLPVTIISNAAKFTQPMQWHGSKLKQHHKVVPILSLDLGHFSNQFKRLPMQIKNLFIKPFLIESFLRCWQIQNWPTLVRVKLPTIMIIYHYLFVEIYVLEKVSPLFMLIR